MASPPMLGAPSSGSGAARGACRARGRCRASGRGDGRWGAGWGTGRSPSRGGGAQGGARLDDGSQCSIHRSLRPVTRFGSGGRRPSRAPRSALRPSPAGDAGRGCAPSPASRPWSSPEGAAGAPRPPLGQRRPVLRIQLPHTPVLSPSRTFSCSGFCRRARSTVNARRRQFTDGRSPSVHPATLARRPPLSPLLSAPAGCCRSR